MLRSIWLVYTIDDIKETKASDDDACALTVFARALTMKHHFVCQQMGSRRECSTNAELADMHLLHNAGNGNGGASQW
ncbi:hypothetical protein TNCV_2104691 [Trichonephila clavipes]|nr:hypothetical protein TNCV_2104691 [Trichonephila clavipes]